MPITIVDRATIIAQAFAFFKTRWPSKSLSDVRFLGKMASAFGMLATGIQSAVQDADADGVPLGLGSKKASTAALDGFAVAFGLPSNSGGYGRNGAEAATGGVISIAGGTPGATYTSGTQLVGPDGVTRFATTADVTLDGSGAGTSVSLTAVTAGSAGNLATSAALTFLSVPGTATITSVLSGGVDVETDSALLDRILARLRNPPGSGTAHDFKVWSESVPQTAPATGFYPVTAYVYGRRIGTGTVDVALVLAAPAAVGADRVSGVSSMATAIAAYVNANNRPVCSSARWFAAAVDTGQSLQIRVTPTSGNEWDWVSNGAAMTVRSATSTSITLTAPAPTNLQNAITAGSQPRIQVLATGTKGVPQQVRCTNYNAGTSTLAVTTMTTTPAANDKCYVGGPLGGTNATTPTIGDILLAHINGLGPSRAAGYNEGSDVWQDTLTAFDLMALAAEALDASGKALVATVVYSSNIPQVLLAGSAFTSYQPPDPLLTAPTFVTPTWVFPTD